RPQRCAPISRGFRAALERGVRRFDQRNLRRGIAIHSTRVYRAGLERGRGPAVLRADGGGKEVAISCVCPVFRVSRSSESSQSSLLPLDLLLILVVLDK